MLDRILLLSEYGDSIEVQLYTEKKPYTIESIVGIKNAVRADIRYSIQMIGSDLDDIDNVVVYINGEEIDTSYTGDTIICNGDVRDAMFKRQIGFVQLSLHVFDRNNTSHWYYSDYASVLVKQTNSNRAVLDMLEYLYMRQEKILYGETMVTSIGEYSADSYNDFSSQIILIEEITNVYENCYGYFMTNSRTKLERVEVVDQAEKLQYIDEKTLQYIVRHPENLKKESTGIRYGRQTFLPNKTLMMQNKITNDIYENRAIISFLDHVLKSVEKLRIDIENYVNLVGDSKEEQDGYIVSSHLLYMNAQNELSVFLARLNSIGEKLRKLNLSYSQILNMEKMPLFRCPESTPVFMSIPQYNRIYVCMMRWFNKQGYDLINERRMLSFFNATEVYELYVLIKLINLIRDMGFKLTLGKSIKYPRFGNWKYESKNHNNTFMFEKEDISITLYYEPILYDEDRSEINDLRIYRNNTVSINENTDEEHQGHYYVPDYVIKVESKGLERYMICDAKFAGKSNVQNRLVPKLAYKYLTSVSPISNKSAIEGLYIFYGLTDDFKNDDSFYNRQIPGSKEIKPCIELVPLSEQVPYNYQTNSCEKMIKRLIESINQ